LLDDTGLSGDRQLISCAQVHDAVAFFQHAGVIVPADCVAFVSTCRKAVQSMQRMDLCRNAALQTSLAQAVEELMQEAASPTHVEACHPQTLQCPSNHRARRLLEVAEFMRSPAAIAPPTGLPTMRMCNALDVQHQDSLMAAAVATTAGASARSQGASKRARYARRGLWGGYKLVPVSVESFERLGAPAYALLRRVADVAAGGDGVSKAAFIESALQEMMATSRWPRATGACCVHLSRVAQGSGRAYLRELPVPVAEIVGSEG
jgi:hypothetical protein